MAAPVVLWNEYVTTHIISRTLQIPKLDHQSIAIDQLTRSIDQRQRNITTLRLCQPEAHYAPNYTITEEHWHKIVIPQKDNPSNQVAFNESTHFWKFYDAEIKMDQGEIRIPLIRGWQPRDVWLVGWFTNDDIEWFKQRESNHLAHCTITYNDGTVKQSNLHLSATGQMGSNGHDPKPWATCTTEYYKIPTSITVTVIDESYPIDHFLHSQHVDIPICQFTTPVYYAVAQLRSLFSFNVDELIDWISYHYALGIDHFFLHYRYRLTEEQERKLAPLIEGGLLTLERFPLAHSKRGWYEPNTDQDAILLLFSMRIAQHATWALVIDHDEYLHINATLFPRECSNSLWCRSSIKTWLEEHKAYSVIQFDSINVVREFPPENKRPSGDAYRYSSPGRLPMPVQYIWRRSFENVGVIRHSKWLYHVLSVIDLHIHGGTGIRPRLFGPSESTFIYHYHAYPIWHRSHEPEPSAEEKQKRVDNFWDNEAVRDTYVSDVYEKLPWPADTDQNTIRQVRQYMRKHSPSISIQDS